MTTAFQGDAFQANAFQIDANTVSGSFTADAILRVPGSGSFTVNAVIAGPPTTLWFRQGLTTAPDRYCSNTNRANLVGTNVSWFPRSLRTTRIGTGAATSASSSTVNGPTAGVLVVDGSSGNSLEWVSPPLAADVTISGTITFNLWARESNASANVAINAQIERLDSVGAVQDLVVKTAQTAELVTTSPPTTPDNFTATPTSTNFNKGDRIRILVFGGDSTSNMASGFTFNFFFDRSVVGTNGESFVTFTETITFQTTDPATTTVYLTDTASTVSTASVDREAWTARGAGVQTDVTNTAAGWVSPIQVTDTAGGTVVDWFTKPLTAFTLSSAVLLNIRGTINSPSNASWRFEIARVANDGSSPTVWGANSIINSPIGSEAAQQFYISGDDLAITAGQRLRLRAYIAPNQDVMVTGKILTLFYAGTSGGASGDTYLIFGETLTENANTVSGSFTADAILRVPGAASFTADAVIAAVTPPVVGTTVVIRLGGVDVTSHVIFADAEFTQQANGQPGSARLRLRDLGHTLSPTAGQTLTVDVNGLRVWGGWALRVSPGYFFAVDDTSNPAQTERVWILEGVDYNILFSKRFLINRLNPTQMLPIYPKDTPDFQVVLDVVQRFLELNNDGISTSGVTHVGTPNLDGDFSAGNPGDSWGTSMNLIAGPTAAVFYIDPNKVLQFVDVETATAPFALSDHPDHTTSFGYRDMEITNDGTKLVNDMMVWGAGAHSTPDTRFVRVQDATSIATHGRWQQGEFTSALFTTSGVTQRAESFVYGTPQSKRGGKDDAIQISCVTYHPGLTAGQIINFSSTVFGYSDTLPIRRLGIRFPNPTSVEFRVFLSYDIDAPWSDYEFWFPRINFQPPTGGGIGGIVWPPIVLPPVTDCSDDVCGITDTFTRTVAETIHTGSSGATVADIGTSDAGRHWGNPTGTLFGLGALLGNGNIGVSVNGSSLLVRGWATALGVPPGSMSMVIPDTGSFTPLAVDHTATKSVTFSMDSLPGHAGNNTVADIYFDVGGGVLNNDPFIWINAMPTSYPIGTFFQSQLSFGPTSAPIAQTLIPNSWWQAGVTYTFTVRDNGTDTIATISDGTTTYTSTHSGFTSDNLPTAGLVVNYETGLGGVSAAEQVIMTFDNFNVPEITRCSQNEFDNFNRIVASGWGTATPSGAVWTLSSLNVSTSVGGAYGVVTMTGAIGGDFARFETTVPTGMTGSFEEVVGFFVSRVSSAADSDQSLILNLGYDQEVILRIGNSTGGFVPGGIVVGSTYAAKTDWTTDPYFLRMSWNADTGEIKARVWLQSDPEPTSWLVTAITSPGSLASVKVEADPLAVSDSIFLDSIDFDYDGKPCYPAGPPPEPGPAVGGVICQQFVGGVHQYTVSQAYTPGTTKVYVDGTFQGLNVEYSETDPTNGIIYFGVAPAPPATVTVCFTATVG